MSSVDSPDWLVAASIGNAVPIFNEGLLTTPGNTSTFGPVQVAPASAVLLLISQQFALASEWQVEWLEGPTAPTESYGYSFNKITTVPSQIPSPVLAPYLSVQATNQAASNNTFGLSVITTQVNNPRAGLGLPQVTATGSVSVPGPGTSPQLPAVMIPGAGKLWSLGGNALAFAEMQYYNGTGWVTYTAAVGAANVTDHFDVDLPIYDYRVNLVNNDSAAHVVNFGLSVSL